MFVMMDEGRVDTDPKFLTDRHKLYQDFRINGGPTPAALLQMGGSPCPSCSKAARVLGANRPETSELYCPTEHLSFDLYARRGGNIEDDGL